MKFKLALALCTLIIGINSWCLADVPQAINFQGRLTDNNGATLTDQTYTIAVSLYDKPMNNLTALWRDIFNAKTKGGYFNIILGKDGIYNNSFNNVDFNQQLYVGISISGSPEMTPLQSLNSVPYAMNAQTAFNALHVANGCITKENIEPSTWEKILPIGTILAWHPNIHPSLPALPDGFVPCNGQTIVVSGGPLNGVTLNIPNLNGATSNGAANSPNMSTKEKMFLRGGTISGIGTMDTLKTHTHEFLHQNRTGYSYSNHVSDWDQTVAADYWTATRGPSTGDASETCPKNMTVVWIMKVK